VRRQRAEYAIVARPCQRAGAVNENRHRFGSNAIIECVNLNPAIMKYSFSSYKFEFEFLKFEQKGE
jgi:hypothetical protein